MNIGKCEWVACELPYLRFILTYKGFDPDPAKIESLLNIVSPLNIKQLRRFLGGINFL